METRHVVASGIVLASAAAFGWAIAPVVRGDREMTEYTDAMMEADPVGEAVAVGALFFFMGLSIHATGRWVAHYRQTGEMMSPEELERTYQ